MTEENAKKDLGQKIRFISDGSDSYQIEAYAPVGADGAARLIIFSRDQIDYIFEHDQKDLSGICLHSGVTIPVRMSLLELNSTIRNPDFKSGTLIDLTAATKNLVIANDDKPTSELRVGDKMKDGTIFAGISPDTGKEMYAAPADESLTLTFNKAKERAEELSKTTGKAYRVPSVSELNVLFNNRAAIGGFNLTASVPAGWYWSSTPYNGVDARCQRLSDGSQFNDNRSYGLSVRCVRS
jgi:hypothetical protein